jgi:hypothetical protein
MLDVEPPCKTFVAKHVTRSTTELPWRVRRRLTSRDSVMVLKVTLLPYDTSIPSTMQLMSIAMSLSLVVRMDSCPRRQGNQHKECSTSKGHWILPHRPCHYRFQWVHLPDQPLSLDNQNTFCHEQHPETFNIKDKLQWVFLTNVFLSPYAAFPVWGNSNS